MKRNTPRRGRNFGEPGLYDFVLAVRRSSQSIYGWVVVGSRSVPRRWQPSQMPRHLISDAHEWINEIPTVPIYYLAKPQPRERTWEDQRGKKTLLSLTLVSFCRGAFLA